MILNIIKINLMENLKIMLVTTPGTFQSAKKKKKIK